MSAVLFRLVLVGSGYCLACLAGLATLILAAPETGLFSLPAFSTAVELLARAATIVALVAEAPVVTIAALGLAAVVITEIGEIRGWMWHVGLWGAAGGAAALGLQWLWHAGAPAGVGNRIVIAFAASGFVAGFVYWLVAGRTA